MPLIISESTCPIDALGDFLQGPVGSQELGLVPEPVASLEMGTRPLWLV